MVKVKYKGKRKSSDVYIILDGKKIKDGDLITPEQTKLLNNDWEVIKKSNEGNK